MADSYTRYKDARNAAWGLLERAKIKRLPVDPEALLSFLRIEVLPYPDPENEKRLWQTLRDASVAPCVSLQIGGVWRVFADRTRLNAEQTRFALAHELGHHIMRHAALRNDAGVRTFAGTENEGDIIDAPRSMDDYAADIFAVRLLAPACVLHDLGLQDAAAIARVCGLPEKAAELRAERMRLLNARAVFYILPIEKKVHDLFLPFIREEQEKNAAPVVPRVMRVMTASGLLREKEAREKDAPDWNRAAAALEGDQPEEKTAETEETPGKTGQKWGRPVLMILFAALAILLALLLRRIQ